MYIHLKICEFSKDTLSKQLPMYEAPTRFVLQNEDACYTLEDFHHLKVNVCFYARTP